MIMNAQPSQYGISKDTNARGRARSPLLELYTQPIFGGPKKKSARASAACGGRLRLGCKIDGDRTRLDQQTKTTNCPLKRGSSTINGHQPLQLR